MDTNAEQDAQLYYQEENTKGQNGNFEPTGFGVMRAKVEVFGHAGCESFRWGLVGCGGLVKMDRDEWF